MNTTFVSQKYLCAMLGLLLQTVTCAANNKETAKPATVAGSVVIAWIDNVPVVTQADVDKHKNQMIEEQPQLKQVLEAIPKEEIDKNIAEALLQQNIINIFIKKSGISETTDYKDDLKTAQDMAAAVVNNTYFTDSVSSKLTLSDKELRQFYDEHKNSFPGVLKEKGGIQATGVMFPDEKSAQAFFKALGSKDLKNEAKKQKLSVNDFGSVTSSSRDIDDNIKKSLLEITKFPQAIKVEDKDGNIWVVQALSKKEPVYESFDKVKEQMRERALQYKIADSVSSKLSSLKQEYKVEINQDYFGAEEPLEITHEEMDALMGAMEGMEGLEGLDEEDLANLM